MHTNSDYTLERVTKFSVCQYSSPDIFVRDYKLLFYMANTRQKIIIDLIGNIHTVLSIYVFSFAKFNNTLCFLVAIRS